MSNKWLVYVLINNSIPIYVGCTSNIKRRVVQHAKSGKVFTGYVKVKSYDIKECALIGENSIIRYLSMFGNPENINGKYVNIQDNPLLYGNSCNSSKLI